MIGTFMRQVAADVLRWAARKLDPGGAEPDSDFAPPQSPLTQASHDLMASPKPRNSPEEPKPLAGSLRDRYDSVRRPN